MNGKNNYTAKTLKKYEIAILIFVLTISVLTRLDILIYIIVIAYVLYNITSPHKILYLYILAYPFAYTSYSKLNLGSITIGIDDMILLFVPLVIIINEKKLREQLREPQQRKYIMLAILLVLCSLIFVTMSCMAHTESINYVSTFTGYSLTFIAVLLFCRKREHFNTCITLLKVSITLVVLSAILSSYGIWEVHNIEELTGSRPSGYRQLLGAKYASTGLISGRGGFGINISFILPFIFMALIEKDMGGPIKRATGIVLMILIIVAVIVSGSRSTWLATLLVITSFIYMYGTRKSVAFFLIAMLSLIAIMFCIEVFITLFKQAYEMETSSVDNRMLGNVKAFKVMLNNPLFGIPQSQFINYDTNYKVVHNFFLNIGYQFGIPSLLCVSALFLYIISMLVNNVNSFKICLISGLIGILIELSFYGGGEKQLWMYLALMIRGSTIWENQQ